MAVALKLVSESDEGLDVSSAADNLDDDIEFYDPRFIYWFESCIFGRGVEFLRCSIVDSAEGANEFGIAIDIDTCIVCKSCQ